MSTQNSRSLRLRFLGGGDAGGGVHDG